MKKIKMRHARIHAIPHKMQRLLACKMGRVKVVYILHILVTVQDTLSALCTIVYLLVPNKKIDRKNVGQERNARICQFRLPSRQVEDVFLQHVIVAFIPLEQVLYNLYPARSTCKSRFKIVVTKSREYNKKRIRISHN